MLCYGPDVVSARRRWGAQLGAIGTVGLAVRLIYVFAFKNNAPLIGDSNYYHNAANLLPRHGFIEPILFLYSAGKQIKPAADHPPGYIVALAGCSWLGLRSVLAHQIWSALIGTLSVIVIGLAGRRIAGPRVGFLAAALAAVYPNLWIYDALVMSETLTILLAAVVIWMAYRLWWRPGPWPAAALGTATAALVLTRAEALLLVVLLVLPLCLTLPALGWRRRFGLLVIAELVIFTSMLPWVGFNLTRFHRPVLVSNGLGFTMKVANCDATFHGPFIGYWRYSCGIQTDPQAAKADPGLRGDASDVDVVRRKQAMTYISHHLGRLPAVEGARLGRTWGFFHPAQQVRLDRAESGRDVPAASIGLIMSWTMTPAALAGALALKRRRLPLTPVVAMVIVVCVAVLITFGQTRYGALAEPSRVLLTAVAADTAWTKWTHRAGCPDRACR